MKPTTTTVTLLVLFISTLCFADSKHSGKNSAGESSSFQRAGFRSSGAPFRQAPDSPPFINSDSLPSGVSRDWLNKLRDENGNRIMQEEIENDFLQRNTFNPLGPSEGFGGHVSSAGDVNGDGFNDIIIGALHYKSDTGRAYIYYGGTNWNTEPDVILTGEVTSEFGSSVSSGDFNGDGYSDVALGAHKYNSNTGRVYIYFGGSSMNNIADVVFTGEGTNNYFGQHFSSTGDVNNDGYSDLIVGAYGNSSDKGRAYVYFGGLSMDNTPDVIMIGEFNGENFGSSASSAGDVNGDGFDDVIVGAYSYNGGIGRAFIFFGGSTMNNTPDVIMNGEGGNFGVNVSNANDVNGDGFADVIIGAYRYANVGKVYLYFGGSSMNSGVDVTITGAVDSAVFGMATSSAGDINRDGYSDIIVGAAHPSQPGKAFVYFGGASMNNIADVTMNGESLADNFGVSVSSTGDFNGDGFTELLVGASEYNSQKGRVYFYEYNVPGNITSDTVRKLTGLSTFQGFGMSVSSAGDVNNDGFADILVGSTWNASTGKAYLFFGGLVFDTNPDVIMYGEEGQNSEFGKVVSSAGDVNGDGYSDVIVGAQHYNLNTGRAYIFLGGAAMDNVADIIMTGETTDRYLGSSVSSADFNRDGFSDVLVGEPGYSSNTGRAHIFLGGAAMDNIPDVTMTGESNNSYFGMVSSPAGDVNGDSYPDVIISATHYGGETGRAYIYYGGSSMNNGVDLTLNGENGYFGSWTAAGDVNADGFSDVVVGAYRFGAKDAGKVYLFYGGNPMNVTADLTFIGADSALLGMTLASVGDLNKDGYTDIILPSKGKANVYLGGAPMDTIADIIKYQDTPGENYAFVSSGGDINGDGHLEYIVGAPWFNSSTGKVYIYDYRTRGETISDLIMTGEGAENYFGSAVSSAGDVNNDGYDDMIVGAPTYSSNRGRTYIYFGGAQLNNTPDIILTGQTTNNYFGLSVSSAGDVNNDGYSDVIVGALWYGGGTGRAYIYFGGASMDDTADVTLNGEGGYFGCCVASAGDVNGDTISDVIVGAYRYGSNTGRAYIYYGGSAMDDTADVIMDGEASKDLFANWSSPAGDVNGDGYSDVIIGAGHDRTDPSLGKAYIYFGGPVMNNVADVKLIGEQLADAFGAGAFTAGDVNGDGFSDVIVGANSHNGNIGKAYIYFGGATMDTTADVIMNGEGVGNFGGRVFPIGDFNADGFSDVIIAAQAYASSKGKVYIFFGGESMNNIADVTLVGEAPNDEFGVSISSAGDVNGDGFPDIIIGAQGNNSNTGKAYLYLASAIGSPVNKRFRSKTSGNWNSPLTWEMSTNEGSSWVPATSYPNDLSDEITIRSPHVVALTKSESASRIVIDNGATLDISSENLKLSGFGTPLTKNGNLVTTNSTIDYNGTTAQSLTPNVTYNNLTINNPTGVTVASNFSIPGTLSILNGDLDLNGNTITLSTNASLFETTGNTVKGVTGSITTSRLINQPNSLNIGGLGAIVTSSENFGTTTITRRHTIQNVSAGTPSIRRHFTISPQNNSALNATFIFRYDPSELDTINESSLGLYRSTNGGLNYLPEGGIVDTANNQIALSFVQSFSMWSAARFSDTLNSGLELTDNIYAKGKLCVNWGSIDTVRVRINRSEIPENDSMKIQYTIKNRETFEINFDSILTIPSFQQLYTLISLRMPSIRQPGPHSVIVQAIPDELDPINGFDIRTYCFDVTCDEFSYIEPCDTLDGSTGFDGSDGKIVAGFDNLNASDTFPIHRIDHSFKNPGSGNVPYRIAVYKDDGTGKPGTELYISQELTTPAGNGSVQDTSHIVDPPVEIPPLSRFYVGYIQVSSANIHVSYQDEAPVRSNTFFFSNSFTNNNWTDFSDSSRNYRIDISPRTSTGSSSLSSLISLRLNAFLEGFYNPATKKMRTDTVKVEVRSFTQPYDKIDESTAILDSGGTGIFHFSNVDMDSDYYFVIHHRNHIETWSHASPQKLYSCGSEYDFTRSDSCAFGRNLFLIDSSPLRFAVYSGDVNQDGTVDATDVSAIDNDAANFSGGYIATDLNGDDFVDGSDFVIADNNATIFVSAIIP